MARFGGLLVYVVFASGERQSWADSNNEQDNEQEKEHVNGLYNENANVQENGTNKDEKYLILRDKYKFISDTYGTVLHKMRYGTRSISQGLIGLVS